MVEPKAIGCKPVSATDKASANGNVDTGDWVLIITRKDRFYLGSCDDALHLAASKSTSDVAKIYLWKAKGDWDGYWELLIDREETLYFNRYGDAMNYANARRDEIDNIRVGRKDNLEALEYHDRYESFWI